MPRSKEIPEDIRRQVVEAHKSGKGYKLISKAIGLPKTTIRAILRKWKRFGTVVTLPRSGRPSKISLRARREIIREVMKNPCTTSKDIQATLALSNICVHQSTIRRILGIHGRPTLSSFEGSVALQSTSQEEEDVLSASDAFNRDVKNEEELQDLNTNKAECPDNNNNNNKNNKNKNNKNKEGAGHDKNSSKQTSKSNKDNKSDENKNQDDEMPAADVNSAGGGAVEKASTNHNSGEHRDGSGERRKCDDGAGTNPNIGGSGADVNKKRRVETVVSRRSSDAGDGKRHDASSASSAHCNENRNNNRAGNWSEEMDYISTLAFS